MIAALTEHTIRSTPSPRGRRRHWRSTWLLIVLMGMSSAGLQADEDGLRATMRSALETLTRVLPASLSPKGQLSAADRALMKEALDSLGDDALAIGIHVQRFSRTHALLGEVFAEEVVRLRRHYDAERYEYVRRGLLDLTRTCFACHSKLPAADDRDLGRGLMQDPRVEALPLYRKAVLAGAVRRFDQALGYYEALFRTLPTGTKGFSWAMAIERYLILALRVRRDPDRPTHVLVAFSRRDGVPPYLARYVRRWVAALGEVDLDADPGRELDRARALFARAERIGDYPADPATRVHYIGISSLLHRYLLRDGQSAAERSQAWYLLGVAESHLTSAYWTGETEYFLERAILAAPGTALARRAYRFLEDYVVVEYSGSAGLSLPPEAAARLSVLERLAERPAP